MLAKSSWLCWAFALSLATPPPPAGPDSFADPHPLFFAYDNLCHSRQRIEPRHGVT
jgi:hypothetical protein